MNCYCYSYLYVLIYCLICQGHIKIIIVFITIRLVGGGVQWGPIDTAGDYDDGELGGMKVGRGNQSTRRKLASAPLCPPQIPLDQTRAAAVGSQQLTA
jgi:hypothetical protein